MSTALSPAAVDRKTSLVGEGLECCTGGRQPLGYVAIRRIYRDGRPIGDDIGDAAKCSQVGHRC